jgi:hypothetical protein
MSKKTLILSISLSFILTGCATTQSTPTQGYVLQDHYVSTVGTRSGLAKFKLTLPTTETAETVKPSEIVEPYYTLLSFAPTSTNGTNYHVMISVKGRAPLWAYKESTLPLMWQQLGKDTNALQLVAARNTQLNNRAALYEVYADAQSSKLYAVSILDYHKYGVIFCLSIPVQDEMRKLILTNQWAPQHQFVKSFGFL